MDRAAGTREASIFSRMLDDPRTTYYFLFVSKSEIKSTIGWELGLEAKIAFT